MKLEDKPYKMYVKARPNIDTPLKDLPPCKEPNRLYNLTEIGLWVYNELNIPNPRGLKQDKRHKSTIEMLRPSKYFTHTETIFTKELMPLIQNKKERTCHTLSYNIWKHNRKIFHKYGRKKWLRNGGWFATLDYFFSNLEKYNQARDKLLAQYEAHNKVICTYPAKDEPLYLAGLVTRNPDVFRRIKERLIKQGCTPAFKKQKVTMHTTNPYIADFVKVRVNLLSLPQMKSLIWRRENYKRVFPNSYESLVETDVTQAYKNIRDFIKNPLPECLYVEGKKYHPIVSRTLDFADDMWQMEGVE